MDGWELHIGSVVIPSEGIITVELQPLGMSPRRGRVELHVDAPNLRSVDFSLRASLHTAGSAGPEFTGLVERAAGLATGAVEVALVTEDVLWQQQQLDGMVHWRADRLDGVDALYSLVRALGQPSDEMNFDVYTPRSAVFEVAAPVTGVKIATPIPIGTVTLSAGSELRRALDDVSDAPDLVRRWKAAEAWALATPQAENLIDAERAGLENIDAALGCLLLGTRLSTFSTPTGGEAGFDLRSTTLVAVTRVQIVHVRSLSDGRRWVRGLALTRDETQVRESDVRVSVNPPSDARTRLALDAWRRAVLEADPLNVLAAIWQAWEFYAAGFQSEALFTRTDRDRLQASVSAATSRGFTDAQLEQVTKLIAEQVNSRPLLDAIADSLKRDGVPFTMEDMEVLRRHRRVRNDVDHGRRLVLPSPRDAREVLSLLTRALGWRLAQSSAEA